MRYLCSVIGSIRISVSTHEKIIYFHLLFVYSGTLRTLIKAEKQWQMRWKQNYPQLRAVSFASFQ